jgi:dienelactone hydrolase
MKRLLFLASLIIPMSLLAESTKGTPPRDVDLKSADGTILKASYYAASKPGPGVLLFPQVNRTRKPWDDVARQLAAAGINTLTVDIINNRIGKEFRADLDAAFQFLVSSPVLLAMSSAVVERVRSASIVQRKPPAGVGPK